jgi:hypothetical protein
VVVLDRRAPALGSTHASTAPLIELADRVCHAKAVRVLGSRMTAIGAKRTLPGFAFYGCFGRSCSLTFAEFVGILWVRQIIAGIKSE